MLLREQLLHRCSAAKNPKNKKGRRKERKMEGSPSRVLYILYLIAAAYIMQYLSAAQHSYK